MMVMMMIEMMITMMMKTMMIMTMMMIVMMKEQVWTAVGVLYYVMHDDTDDSNHKDRNSY